MQTDMKGRAIAQSSTNTSGNKGGNTGFALQVFGKNIRESNCDCDRSMEASLLQTVYLQNDNQVLQACNGGPDTWMDQVSRELKGIGTQAKEKATSEEELKKELAQLKSRFERIQKDKESDKQRVQSTRIKERMAELLAKLPAPLPAKSTVPKLTDEQSARLIEQAYLRTLSRSPTADEVKNCREFIDEAATPTEGLKGLIWTLLNTKEFIVNH